MGAGIGKVFGSTDGLDANGNPLPNNATPDQLGISGGQMFARKALAGGLKGLGQGLQQQSQNANSRQRMGYVPQSNPFYGG